MIKLCVPGRFEPELVDRLAEINSSAGGAATVHEVYGSLSKSVVGSGRPAMRLAQQGGEPTFETVGDFVRRAHDAGIRVNYLLNSIVLSNGEYTTRGRREILDYVARIDEAGVDIVTISVPYLMELVRAHFPDLPVCVSVVNELASVHGIATIREFEPERMHVSEEVNRDHGLLRRLADACGVELSLVVNNGCLRFCPYRGYHHSLCSQGSQTAREAHGYVDWPLLRCSRARASEPVEIFRSPWLRPEDLPFYADRFGIEHFKIAGRQLPLQWILRVTEAYARCRYDGNLMDLLATPAANFARHPMTARIAEERGTHRFVPPPLWIDNRELDGFSAALRARGGCGADRDCERCRLCDLHLERATRHDPDAERAEHARALGELIDDLVEGRWSSDRDPARAVDEPHPPVAGDGRPAERRGAVSI